RSELSSGNVVVHPEFSTVFRSHYASRQDQIEMIPGILMSRYIIVRIPKLEHGIIAKTDKRRSNGFVLRIHFSAERFPLIVDQSPNAKRACSGVHNIRI